MIRYICRACDVLQTARVRNPPCWCCGEPMESKLVFNYWSAPNEDEEEALRAAFATSHFPGL